MPGYHPKERHHTILRVANCEIKPRVTNMVLRFVLPIEFHFYDLKVCF